MPTSPATVTRTYYVLVLGNTVAASLIWGINTIFLLDAGLSNLEAFAANAFFTAGMVLFEVPTGIVADMWGRRVSFLLGTVTLAVATGLYVLLWEVRRRSGRGPSSRCSSASASRSSPARPRPGWWTPCTRRDTGRSIPCSRRAQILGGVGMLTGSVAGG